MQTHTTSKVMGEIPGFRDILMKEYEDQGLIHRPAILFLDDYEKLPTIFPPKIIENPNPFIHLLSESEETMTEAVKIEIAIRYGQAHRVKHAFVIAPKGNSPDFVCGFVDHNDSYLQKWRNL